MANAGVAPLEPTTDVGKFRLLFPDSVSVALEPPVAGQGDYTYFSDEEIERLLDQGVTPTRAVAYGWLQLAGAAALAALSVKDYDLAIDSTKRAEELRTTADYWFARADSEDALGGENDVFNLFDMAGPRCSHHELTERCTCRVLF